MVEASCNMGPDHRLRILHELFQGIDLGTAFLTRQEKRNTGTHPDVTRTDQLKNPLPDIFTGVQGHTDQSPVKRSGVPIVTGEKNAPISHTLGFSLGLK
jgi:hypothetical protein